MKIKRIIVVVFQKFTNVGTLLLCSMGRARICYSVEFKSKTTDGSTEPVSSANQEDLN